MQAATKALSDGAVPLDAPRARAPSEETPLPQAACAAARSQVRDEADCAAATVSAVRPGPWASVRRSETRPATETPIASEMPPHVTERHVRNAWARSAHPTFPSA
jgi:hypothetical protein